MFRPRALRSIPRVTARVATRSSAGQRRAFVGQTGRSSDDQGLDVRRMAQARADWERMRRNFLMAGSAAGIISCGYIAYLIKVALQQPDVKLDSVPSPSDSVVTGGADGNRKVVVHDDEGREIIPTGNSSVPYFPRTIELAPTSITPVPPADAIPSITSPTLIVPPTTNQVTEYTLVGLGLRSVTFIGIQVYVVGYYIATADIAALQSRLVKRVNPIASTLVSGEKDELKKMLLDPVGGEALWQELLQENIPARSVFRVVPTRNTDFHHLRDGFVRAIQARTRDQPQGDDFGEHMAEFQRIFNRGKVPKEKELLLIRDKGGELSIAYDDGQKAGRQILGSVKDELLSRALWLNYLAGKNVASEPARQAIVNGVMEFVERPIGTVAAQVV